MKQFYIDNPEERAKRSQESTLRCEDPEHMKIRTESLKKSWENADERREKASQRMIDRYANMTKLEKSEIFKKGDTPEKRNKLSKRFSGKGSSSYKEVDTVRIIKLKEEGKSIKEISDIIKCSVGIIKERLKNPEKYL